jgi:mannose-6-phosphate isomerase-like protein (cupin superfamily)
VAHDTELALLVVLAGRVGFATDELDDGRPVVLSDGDSVAIPGGTRYRLVDPGPDCQLLDVTLPAEVSVNRAAGPAGAG